MLGKSRVGGSNSFAKAKREEFSTEGDEENEGAFLEVSGQTEAGKQTTHHVRNGK